MPQNPPPTIRIVCATRGTQDDFVNRSALGRSLAIYQLPFIQIRLFETNSTGLSTLYNRAIEESRANPAFLVLIHDDVHLCDFFWIDRILGALNSFEVVGLAGNKRRVPRQPAWAFVDEQFTWDSRENLSGVVGHGAGFPPANLSIYGPPFQEVKLLDGLMLACRSETLLATDLRFDERFDFHFYDMDFCREAERRNLRMGTCPISLIHESGGSFGGTSWRAGYARYLDKWQT